MPSQIYTIQFVITDEQFSRIIHDIIKLGLFGLFILLTFIMLVFIAAWHSDKEHK